MPRKLFNLLVNTFTYKKLSINASDWLYHKHMWQRRRNLLSILKLWHNQLNLSGYIFKIGRPSNRKKKFTWGHARHIITTFFFSLIIFVFIYAIKLAMPPLYFCWTSFMTVNFISGLKKLRDLTYKSVLRRRKKWKQNLHIIMWELLTGFIMKGRHFF